MQVNFKAKLKSRFLDREIAKGLDPVQRKFLSWIGRDAMRAGRRNLKKPRQKRISELTDKERQQYRIQQALFRDGVLSEKPKRPPAPAAPGEPARVRFRPNPLRDGATGILFALNDKADGVLIGPSPFGDNAADDIEERHPFMGPALEKIIPTIPRVLARARS